MIILLIKIIVVLRERNIYLLAAYYDFKVYCMIKMTRRYEYIYSMDWRKWLK